MIFNEPLTDIISKRTSCRSYEDQPIDEQKIIQLNDMISSVSNKVPFNTALRFELLTATEQNKNELKNLTTYGMVKNAAGFIIGAVQQSSKNMEDFGYAMEKIILYATHIELGTCWLGGTFNKSSFARKISAKESETVPAVAAVGHKKSKRTAIDSVIRWAAGSKNRYPWEKLFFVDSFQTPIEKMDTGDFEIPLEMVRLSPSASNKQPWRIVKEKKKNVFHFFIKRNKMYKKNIELFQLSDLQRIDIGIAMCHFELTAQEANLKGKWVEDDPLIEDLPEIAEYIVSWKS
jgi:nitroreductase